jgi:LCP family protein required for cell wall assembly
MGEPSPHPFRTWWTDSILNPSDVAPPSAGRSPSLTAFLSFLWPGLGHWYTHRRRAALLFALPLLGVVAVLVIQAVGGVGRVAALLFSPSSALTVAILVILLGAWREVAMLDAVSAIRPRGSWRSRSSLLTVGLLSFVIVATHVWVGYVAFEFYGAGSRIFVGAEGPDSGQGGLDPGASGSPALTDDPGLDYVAVVPFATPPSPTSRINVLLTGVDSAENRDHALNDTLIIASIDPTSRDVALVSFPRDISDFPLVDGGSYRGKINSFMTYVRQHPDQFPDAPLVELVRELSFLVGAPIHYYAAVDLAGFRRMIDAVDGVTVTVTTAINDVRYDWLDGRHGFSLSTGVHKLDGENALAYVRSRYTPGDNDFNRSRRQQQVLLALAHKLTQPDMLPRIPELINIAGDTIRTNFPSDRVGEMLDMANGLDGSAVTQIVLGPPYAVAPPLSETGGTYILRMDMAKIAKMSRLVFGSESTYPQP